MITDATLVPPEHGVLETEMQSNEGFIRPEFPTAQSKVAPIIREIKKRGRPKKSDTINSSNRTEALKDDKLVYSKTASIGKV